MKSKISLAVFLFYLSIISVIGQEALVMKKNRFYLDGQRISLHSTKLLMEDNSFASQLFSKGVSQRTTANILGFSGGFLIGWPIGQAIGKSRKEPNWILAFAGLGGITIGYMLDSASQKKFNSALDFYHGTFDEESLEKENQYNLLFGFTQNGLGATLYF